MPPRGNATSDTFGGPIRRDARSPTDILLTPSEVMVLHVGTGYQQDDRNRLVAINDWQQRSVPRFWLGRTPESVIWRFRHDLPESICVELDSVCCREKVFDTNTAQVAVDSYQKILRKHGLSAAPCGGPVYWFPLIRKVRGEAIRISSTNEYLLRDRLASWCPDVPHQQPMLVVVEGEKAISVCASVRKSTAAHAAGVETCTEYRGRGHAANAVLGWAVTVQEMGLVALFSTSWANQASQTLATKAGATLIGEELHFT